MDTTINTSKRPTATKVGTREEFDAIVAEFSGQHANLQVALAQMVAFAYAAYHRDGDTGPIDHIRATVRLSKDAARRLSNGLSRISREPVPEGEQVAKVALRFGNEFAADFYGEETKARAAKRDAARAKREEKAKQDKAKADADLKQVREEAKAEARAEVEQELDLPEFALLGEDGHVTPLTPEEYTALALTLSEMRQAREDAAARTRKADRDTAKRQLQEVA